MWLRVVGSVGVQVLRKSAGAVRLAVHRRDVVNQRQQFVDVRHVGPGAVGHQRHALAVGQDVVLGPGFASIRRIGAGLIAAPQGTGLGTIDGRARPIELVGLLEFGQEDLLQLLPDPGPLPGIEVVQTGHATATAHLLGQLLPGDARLEDEDDAGENLAVIQRLASGEPEATRLGLGKSGSIRCQSSSLTSGLAMGDPPNK